MNGILNFFEEFGMVIIIIITTFFVIKALLRSTLKQHHSHWNTLLSEFSFSTQEFYKLLKEDLQEQGIKAVKFDKVSLKEGNAFSSKRSYLRATWKEYQYDICAAPFGKGFFISWWLLYKISVGQIIVSRIPFIGKWLERKLYPITYYKVDTASMFMTYAQASVLRVIEKITQSKGNRALKDTFHKPILKDVFQR